MLRKRFEDSAKRRAALEEALNDKHNPAFINARMAITLEEEYQVTLKRDLRAASIEPLAQDLPQLAIGLILVVVFAFVAARLASTHGSVAIGDWSRTGTLSVHGRVYWSWVAIAFLPHLVREIWTSILSAEKSWTGWNSFCISSVAWGLMVVTAFGAAMVIAYPASILWLLASARNRPVALDVGHTDGRWGVGSYVLFLQTWSISSLLFLVLPSALWLRALRDHPGLSKVYLLPPALLLVSAFVISGRMVGNAVAIRQRIQSELGRLGSTWQSIQEKKPAPDPTVSFIGEHWWNLPTIIIGALAVLWVMVEGIGVSDFLLKLAGLK